MFSKNLQSLGLLHEIKNFKSFFGSLGHIGKNIFFETKHHFLRLHFGLGLTTFILIYIQGEGVICECLHKRSKT